MFQTAKKSEYQGIFHTSSCSVGVNNLNGIKFGGITLLLFGMVIALTGIVYADQVVAAVPETRMLGTVTTADVIGLVTETDAGMWSVSSGGIPISGDDPLLANYPNWSSSPYGSYQGFKEIWDHDIQNWQGMHLQDELNYILNHPGEYPPEFQSYANDLLNWAQNQGGLHDPPLYDKEVRYTTVYDANIVAQAGHTSLVKNMNIDTRNKGVGQSNVNARTALTYIATADGGNAVGSENLLIDGVGMPTNASDRMLCPFSSQPIDVIPAYCNIVQAGSTYDLTVGSVTTNANNRFVGTDATNPVVLNYDINVRPYGTYQGQIPASGSSMAYIKAHIQESRGLNSTLIVPVEGTAVPGTGIPLKVEDLTYNEQSGAQGTITSFSKVIAYQSGRALL